MTKCLAYIAIGPWRLVECLLDLVLGTDRKRRVDTIPGWLDRIRRGMTIGGLVGIVISVSIVIAVPALQNNLVGLAIFTVGLSSAYLGASIAFFTGGRVPD